MNYRKARVFLTIYFLILCYNTIRGQTNFNPNQKLVSGNNQLGQLDQIKLSRWKGGANACLNISFDDGCVSQKAISEVFDQFGFKASFFIIPSALNHWYTLSTIDVKDILKRGHEIGNHTYSHSLQFSTETDSSKIDYEIRKGKEAIEEITKVSCASFADPYHQNSNLSKSILFKYHLFSRDYSIYYKYDILSIDSLLRINTVMSYINSGIKKSNFLLMAGHGIDNDGYSPITKKFLIQILDSAKHNADNNKLWITTLKEGEQYDNLYHEIKLTNEVHQDTLFINFHNFNKSKYKSLQQSPMSIEIPFTLTNSISIVNDSINLKKLSDKFVLTTDLNRDTILAVIFKELIDLSKDLTTSISSPDYVKTLTIYPNPVSNILHLKTTDNITSVDITNMSGVSILRRATNQSQLDVSNLEPGLYIINVKTNINNKAKFFKQ